MRALVLVADHTPDRLCHAAAARVAEAAEGRGGTAIVRDLHAESFRIAMTPEERAAYHSEDPILDPLVADHARDVRNSDVLVFAYTTMFSTVPAILKGWLDRVLVKGVAFEFDAKGKVTPAMTHVRRIVGISTYDEPRVKVKAVHDNGRRTIVRAVRMSAGLRTSTAWVPLYRAGDADDTSREAFLDRSVAKVVR